MVQKFAELEALVSANIDSLYGELTRIEPRADGDLVKGVPDPERPIAEVVGIVDFEPKVLKSRYGGRYDGDTPDLSGDKLHVSYDLDRLPYPLRQGDRIVAIERPGQPVFAISAGPENDGIGRVLCRCKPGRPAP